MTARPVEMRWRIRILPTFFCTTGFTFACALCFLLFSVPRSPAALHASPNEQTAGVHYAVVVDAGSSGSRLYIYRCDYDRHTVKSILRVSPLLGRDGEPIVKKKNPGLSSFGNDPEKAVVYMKGLINGALDYIPKENVKQTSLFVLATAGMRLLPVQERTKVMKALQRALASSYDFIVSETNIEIISGKWEGIYAWISVNYALGRFERSPLLQTSVSTQPNSIASRRIRTAGILDLGGASLQVAYEVKRSAVHGLLNESFYQEINLGCNDTSPLFKFTVFVNTYLGYGANTAIELYENWLAKNLLKNRINANSSKTSEVDHSYMVTTSLSLPNFEQLVCPHVNKSKDNLPAHNKEPNRYVRSDFDLLTTGSVKCEGCIRDRFCLFEKRILKTAVLAYVSTNSRKPVAEI